MRDRYGSVDQEHGLVAASAVAEQAWVPQAALADEEEEEVLEEDASALSTQPPSQSPTNERRQQVMMGVVGGPYTGKTSLLHGILGRPFLPPARDPTRRRVVRLRHLVRFCLAPALQPPLLDPHHLLPTPLHHLMGWGQQVHGVCQPQTETNTVGGAGVGVATVVVCRVPRVYEVVRYVAERMPLARLLLAPTVLRQHGRANPWTPYDLCKGMSPVS